MELKLQETFVCLVLIRITSTVEGNTHNYKLNSFSFLLCEFPEISTVQIMATFSFVEKVAFV